MKAVSAISSVGSAVTTPQDLKHRVEETKLEVTDIETAFITGVSVSVMHSNDHRWFLFFGLQVREAPKTKQKSSLGWYALIHRLQSYVIQNTGEMS